MPALALRHSSHLAPLVVALVAALQPLVAAVAVVVGVGGSGGSGGRPSEQPMTPTRAPTRAAPSDRADRELSEAMRNTSLRPSRERTPADHAAALLNKQDRPCGCNVHLIKGREGTPGHGYDSLKEPAEVSKRGGADQGGQAAVRAYG